MLAQFLCAARIARVQDKSIDQTDTDLSGGLAASRLRHALDNDEFALFCQPILALSGTTRYPMAEVLIRLREEETAMLPPGEFLPVFEHYKMMPQLDRWVVRQVVRRLAKGSRVPWFTINVSSQTIEDGEFPAFFAAEMKAAAPRSVLFEINESDLIARPQAVARFVAAIKSGGGGAVMDSFGRKSVSFGPLKALAPDFVKVDGAIIRKLLKSEVARTKLSAVMRVGQALPFGVIAECVEEQDVLLRLKAMGVGFAQGFGVHQPQPIDAIAEKS
jgi:EAL domain-containing protein (putative c-di-GMP-specific phosphodiesterase class I)